MSTSRAVFDDERKEMFFFFEVSIFGEFSKSRVAQKKNVDGSKVHAPDVSKQRSSFLSTN